MKQVFILSVVLLTNLFIIGCPSGMYCVPIDEVVCDNTSLPQACDSLDHRRCGFRVKGKYFYCESCDPLICDDAAEAAELFCRGYDSSTKDLSLTDQNQIGDESIVEMKVQILKDALELMNETNE